MLRAASLLLVATALGHSVLGEWLIWSRLGNGAWPRFLGRDDQARRIVRVTWHLATILGLSLAAILAHTTDRFDVLAIAVGLVACAVAIAVGSKARHPGWVAFIAAAALCWLSTR